MAIVLTVLAICIVVIVISLILMALRLHFAPGYYGLRKFHGPPLRPIIGNLLDFSTDLNEHFEIVRKLTQQYKSGFRTKIFGRNHAILFRPDHVEAILKSNVNLEKGFIYTYLQCWLGTGLLTSVGRKWHQRRKLLTPSFHFKVLRQFVPIFNKHSAELCNLLDRTVENDTKPIEIGQYLTLTTLDAICETAMGIELNALHKGSEQPYVNALLKFSELIIQRMLNRNPFLINDFIYSLTGDGKKHAKCLRIMHEFTKQVIAERAAQYTSTIGMDHEENERMAFLDTLLEIRQQGGMDLDEVKEEVDTFMFEGHDTTATALKWALYCIANNPHVQITLCHEITRISGLSGDITAEHLTEMKYLDRVLKETQRLYPSVPVVTRQIAHDLKIDSQLTVPKGAFASVHFFALHRDPDQFPDPDHFDPDRFLPANSVGRHPFAFVPFSAGPRNCIGQKFAQMEMKIILADLVRCFSIESVQETVKPHLLLVLRPSNGIWLKFVPRK